jgi:hypothetical protein
MNHKLSCLLMLQCLLRPSQSRPRTLRSHKRCYPGTCSTRKGALQEKEKQPRKHSWLGYPL